MALTLAAAIGLPAAAATPAARTPHAVVSTMMGSGSGTSSEATARAVQDYAERESAAGALESFEGGVALTILAIVLIVVLVLLLI